MLTSTAPRLANKAKLLVVDPDPRIRSQLEPIVAGIGREKLELEQAHSFPEAAQRTRETEYEACLVNISDSEEKQLPDLLAEANDWEAPVIVLAPSREFGLAALEAGADDYLEWANLNADLLERSIRYVLQKRELSRQAGRLASEHSARLTIQKRNFRLALLSEAAGELLGVEDPVELLGRLYPKLSSHLGLDCYLHHLIDEATEQLILQGQSGVCDEAVAEVRRLDFDAVLPSSEIVGPGEPQGQSTRGVLARRLGLRAYFCYPLMVRGYIVGTLSFGSQRRKRFSPSELIFLQTICHYVATALERKRLAGELTDRANRLAESEQRFRVMAETVPDFLLTGPSDGSCDFCNQQFCDFTGLIREEVTGAGWLQAVHPEDAERIRQAWPRLCSSGESIEMEHRFRSRNGHDRWFISRWRGIRGEAGKVVRWIGSCADIHDRKRAERVLKQSERQFRTIFETSPDCIVMVDEEMRLAKANPAALVVFGLEMDRLLGQNLAEFVRPPGRVEEIRRALLQTGRYSGEMQITRPDGEVLEFDVGAAFSVMPGRHLLVFHNITQRRKMEGQLRESESRFRTLAQALPQIVWTSDPQGKDDFYNERLTETTGFSVERACTEGTRQLLHPDDLEPTVAAWQRALNTGDSFQIEHRIRQKDGTYRWFLSRAVPLRSESGRIEKWFGSATDIHDQKRVAEALAREHAAVENERRRLRAVLDVLPVAVFIANKQGRVTDVNPAVATTWGRLPVLSESLQDFAAYYQGFSPKTGKPLSAEQRGLYRALCKGESVAAEEMEYRRADGNRGTILNHAVAIRDASGEIIGGVAVSVDITDLKRTQRQLLELNDALEQRVRERTRSLLTYQEHLRAMTSELVLTEQRERRRLATELHDYLAQLLVASKMKSKLVSYHIQPSGEAVMKDLRELIDESLKYTRTLIADLSPTILYEAGLFAAIHWLGGQMQRHNLAVEIEQDGESVDMPDDKAVMIFQTVRELLFNVVKHAKVDRATVQIEMGTTELTVTVEDHGIGFDVSRQELHPAGGKFGLFSVRERLAALGGACELHSAPHQGTRAIVRVPLEPARTGEAADYPASTAVVPLVSTGPRRGSIRVLLVDDHKMVREGFRTLIECDPQLDVAGEAANGEEAIELARLLQPDVVIMDINMPKMNGIEATRRIKQEMPHISIIGLSVHDDRALTSSMIEAGASCYLTKGGPSEELSRAIHNVFEAEVNRGK